MINIFSFNYIKDDLIVSIFMLVSLILTIATMIYMTKKDVEKENGNK